MRPTASNGAARAMPRAPNNAPKITMANSVQAGATFTEPFWISGAITKPSIVWIAK